ncbi:MAG: polysulfide reductase NrfD [Chloroflexi bacterium]|nr:polysulfide reductase NrfD [Chloroflexota bacterium]
METRDSAVDGPERGYYGLPVLKPPVWQWEIWSYFFLGGLSAGTFLVASLARLFGDEDDRRGSQVGYLLSVAAILPCPLLLIKDLGRSSRFLNMLRIVKPSSPMSMGIWGLIAFSVCSVLSAWRALDAVIGRPLPLSRALPERLVALVGSAAAIFIGGYTGVLLSVTSVPLWSRSVLLGPTFLAAAFSSGLAALGLALAFCRGISNRTLAKLRPMEVAALAVEGVMLAGFARQSDRAVRPVVSSDEHGHGFLLGAVGMGIILPLLAHLVGPHHRRSAALSSVCALVGGLLLRRALIEGGRVSAEDPQVTFWHTDRPPEKSQW